MLPERSAHLQWLQGHPVVAQSHLLLESLRLQCGLDFSDGDAQGFVQVLGVLSLVVQVACWVGGLHGGLGLVALHVLGGKRVIEDVLVLLVIDNWGV